MFPVKYACSGDPLTERRTGKPLMLAVDFSHKVKDVQLALERETLQSVAIHKPTVTSQDSHFLTMCQEQEECVSEITVVLSPNNGVYSI